MVLSAQEAALGHFPPSSALSVFILRERDRAFPVCPEMDALSIDWRLAGGRTCPCYYVHKTITEH